MNTRFLFFSLLFFLFLQSCSSSRRSGKAVVIGNNMEIRSRVTIKNKVPAKKIDTKSVSPDELVVFAESLRGGPYQYGSADIKKGFDCSGFISYVFTHFKIAVPHTSSDFTNAGKEVTVKESRREILFYLPGAMPAVG